MPDPNKTSNRKYSARLFSRAAMICPHCRAPLDEPVDACPSCDFNLDCCEKAFPFAAPPLSLIIDPAQLLPPGIEKDLRKAYRKVRRRAPQVEISFCFVRLQDGVAIEEFGFWLHNSAPGADETRAWQLLVVGDLTSGRLTLTTGYALEPFIKTELWEAALQELAACIADDQWKEGLNGFLIDSRVLLTAAWQVAERRRLKNRRRQEAADAPPGQSTESEGQAGGKKTAESSPSSARKRSQERTRSHKRTTSKARIPERKPRVRGDHAHPPGESAGTHISSSKGSRRTKGKIVVKGRGGNKSPRKVRSKNEEPAQS